MPRIYLDHNVVTRLAVERVSTPPGSEYEAIRRLIDDGHITFVLSAVSLYEIARSEIEAHVANSIALLNELPLEWLGNPVYLQKQELKRHIAGQLRRLRPAAFNPFNRTMAQLWSTYGAQNIVIGETLADSIWAWHRDPAALREVERAAAETPDAILIGRRAVADGLVRDNQPLIDEEFYRARLPIRTDPHVDLSQERYAELPRNLATHSREVKRDCPAIKVEDLCQRYRVQAGFRPEMQDALDLQHIIGAAAYCDFFVTGDNDIHATFQYIRARWERCPCVVVRSLLDLPRST
ncbi:PIN domain nuclease of toxin-antitoxin system [Paraburkholderia atlantica]